MAGMEVGRGLGSFGASTTGGEFENCDIEPKDSILGTFCLFSFRVAVTVRFVRLLCDSQEEQAKYPQAHFSN